MPSTTLLEYAPQGWLTPLPAHTGNERFWSAFLAQETAAIQQLIAQVQAGEPVLAREGPEQCKYAVFNDVLALAARGLETVSVLDYGGNMGDYYWLARGLAPGLTLDYHCKELRDIVEAATALSPEIIWHTDDQCFEGRYDLVMFSSSLQFLPDWADALRRAAGSTRRYLLLSDVATLRDQPAYVATHRAGGHTCLQIQLNRSEILGTAEAAGVRLLREFEMGPHPPIVNAPEQPTCMGWLFERR